MSSIGAYLRNLPIAGVVVPLVAAAALGCRGDYHECPAIPPARRAALPRLLSETGLFVAKDKLAPDVRPYNPAFALWSDGAEKRRWIALPPGGVIDTRDMNEWIFPEGTRLWKEFRRDGVRVETRLLQKIGPREEDWTAVAYVWNAGGDDAVATWEGGTNVLGTPHDVPASDQCFGCHGGRRSRVLGFSAVQLARAVSDGTVDLPSLAREGRLSNPAPEGIAIPGDDVERAALGYLHANCSHCHNQARPESDGARCYDPDNSMDLRLLLGDLGSVSSTAAFRTTVHLENRRDQMRKRMRSRQYDVQMPPLGTERVDDAGLAAVEAWLRRY